jgi:hypothetical protein
MNHTSSFILYLFICVSCVVAVFVLRAQIADWRTESALNAPLPMPGPSKR